PRIAEKVVPLVIVARHVSPVKREFESWLSTVLARLAADFAMDLTHYDRVNKKYDSSYERPVPREVFDPSATVKENESATLVAEFVETLDPRKNPHLADPQKIKEEGFPGVPYPSLAKP